jgi:hypothetical protein
MRTCPTRLRGSFGRQIIAIVPRPATRFSSPSCTPLPSGGMLSISRCPSEVGSTSGGSGCGICNTAGSRVTRRSLLSQRRVRRPKT